MNQNGKTRLRDFLTNYKVAGFKIFSIRTYTYVIKKTVISKTIKGLPFKDQ